MGKETLRAIVGSLDEEQMARFASDFLKHLISIGLSDPAENGDSS